MPRKILLKFNVISIICIIPGTKRPREAGRIGGVDEEEEEEAGGEVAGEKERRGEDEDMARGTVWRRLRARLKRRWYEKVRMETKLREDDDAEEENVERR